jgi:hypothetical protein
MLRAIQLATAWVAAFFAAVAACDLLVWHLDAPLASDAADSPWALLTMLLVTAALLAAISVTGSVRAVQTSHRARLESWRRMTWAASIIETAGCLVLIGFGTLLFLPSAFGLLAVGVAELASILHDVEYPQAASRRTLKPQPHQNGAPPL